MNQRKPWWFNEQCKETIIKKDKTCLDIVNDSIKENKRILTIRQKETKKYFKLIRVQEIKE